MSSLLAIGLTNAFVMTVLAVVVYCFTRIWRNPVVAHGLWLLVLAKLVVPPLFPIYVQIPQAIHDMALIPRTVDERFVESDPFTPSSAEEVDYSVAEISVDEKTHDDASIGVILNGNHVVTNLTDAWNNISWSWLVAVLWISGSIAWAGVAALRISRFQRLVGRTKPAPDWVNQIASDVATKFGFTREYMVRVTDCHISPSVWSVGRLPKILLPKQLLTELDKHELALLLSHEFAHLRRRDDLVRWLELVVLVAYWWHPVVWWVRHELRKAEEEVCDAWVVRTYPAARNNYGHMLLRTVEILGNVRPTVPLATSGLLSGNHLKTRIHMLMEKNWSHQLAWQGRIGIFLLAALLLPLGLVTSAQQDTQLVHGTELNDDLPKLNNGDIAKKTTTELVLTGTVFDTQGNPVSGLSIQAYNYGLYVASLLTDSNGKVHVPKSLISQHARFCLVARTDEGNVGWWGLPSVRLDEWKKVKDFTITLQKPSTTVRGVIVDSSGNPVSKAPVRIESIFNNTNGGISFLQYAGSVEALGNTLSDVQGKFVLNVPEFRQCGVVIKHPQFIAQEVTYKTSHKGSLKIIVREAGILEGSVINEQTGKPVPRARVIAQCIIPRPVFGWTGNAISDEQGKYRISSLGPGTYNVLLGTVEDKPKLTAVACEAVEVLALKTTNADFQAIIGRSVTGTVIDSDTDTPVPNCQVGYYGAARPKTGAASQMVATDSHGHFQMFIPPGRTKVYIASGGIVPSKTTSYEFMVGTKETPKPVELRGRFRPIRGRVRGRPITGESGYGSRATAVEESTQKSEQEQNAYVLKGKFTTEDGKRVLRSQMWLFRKGMKIPMMWSETHGDTFSLDISKEVPTHYLVIEAHGYARPEPIELSAKKYSKDLLTVELQLPQHAKVTGRVVDANGKPVSDVTLAIALKTVLSSAQEPWGPQLLTDGDGRFEFQHTYVGNQFRVTATKKAYRKAASPWMKISSDSPITLSDITIQR